VSSYNWCFKNRTHVKWLMNTPWYAMCHHIIGVLKIGHLSNG
jgi:hypothetical protein